MCLDRLQVVVNLVVRKLVRSVRARRKVQRFWRRRLNAEFMELVGMLKVKHEHECVVLPTCACVPHMVLMQALL